MQLREFLKRFWKHELSVWLNKFVTIVVSLGLIWLQHPIAAEAQNPPAKPAATPATKPVLLSATGSGAPQVMSDADRAKLKDPLFQLVLKDHADVQTLTDINKFLKPDSQSVSVVDEHIVDTATKVGNSPAERRSVITMRNKDFTDGDVMFSIEFTPDQFQSPNFIEAMGWDESSGSFNYYKLDKRQDEPAATWKFRGNSKDADLLSAASRQGTCMQCHINGAPVMKELDLPWNNWESFSAPTPYLRAGNGSWPIVNAANSPLKNLKGAQILESPIMSAITRANGRRIDSLKSSDGKTIVDAKRLLKPLFVTTEFNLISSDTVSALHPFSPSTGRSSSDVSVPGSFFINQKILNNLNIQTDFSVATVKGQDYDHLIRQTKTTLNGKQPGDTHFAWSVPEASFLDTDWVRQLDEKAIVPRAFSIAALAIDMETPILSADRAKLWSDKILPAQFAIGDNGNLIPQVVKNLTALNPAAGTPEAKFLQLLQKPETVAATVQNQVNQYASRESNLLSDKAKPADRSNEWIRLYKLALKRREAVLADATLKSLDETGGKLLLARGDSTVTVAALPSTTTPVATRPTLKLDAQGDDVVFLQRQLKALGVFNGTIDGDFGPQTQAAVIAAQKRLSLTADGVVGPATWAALQGSIA
jgi:Putative peptidoglycan binding domain